MTPFNKILIAFTAGILFILVIVSLDQKSEHPILSTTPEVPSPAPTLPEKTPEENSPLPTPAPSPTPSPEKSETVIGEEFKAMKGVEYHIAGSRDTFTVTGFFYQPCPKDAACFWSGLDVFYTIKTPTQTFVKDKPMQGTEEFPYSVWISDSDYKTYATLSIKGKVVHQD